MPDLKLHTSQITGVTIAERILGDRTGEIRGRFKSRPREEGTAHVTIYAEGERLHIQTLDDPVGPRLCVALRPQRLEIAPSRRSAADCYGDANVGELARRPATTGSGFPGLLSPLRHMDVDRP